MHKIVSRGVWFNSTKGIWSQEVFITLITTATTILRFFYTYELILRSFPVFSETDSPRRCRHMHGQRQSMVRVRYRRVRWRIPVMCVSLLWCLLYRGVSEALFFAGHLFVIGRGQVNSCCPVVRKSYGFSPVKVTLLHQIFGRIYLPLLANNVPFATPSSSSMIHYPRPDEDPAVPLVTGTVVVPIDCCSNAWVGKLDRVGSPYINTSIMYDLTCNIFGVRSGQFCWKPLWRDREARSESFRGMATETSARNINSASLLSSPWPYKTNEMISVGNNIMLERRSVHHQQLRYSLRHHLSNLTNLLIVEQSRMADSRPRTAGQQALPTPTYDGKAPWTRRTASFIPPPPYYQRPYTALEISISYIACAPDQRLYKNCKFHPELPSRFFVLTAKRDYQHSTDGYGKTSDTPKMDTEGERWTKLDTLPRKSFVIRKARHV